MHRNGWIFRPLQEALPRWNYLMEFVFAFKRVQKPLNNGFLQVGRLVYLHHPEMCRSPMVGSRFRFRSAWSWSISKCNATKAATVRRDSRARCRSQISMVSKLLANAG